MTTTDVKTISWVDDVYQKFEAMCAEVEETMYQVKTVGACVKRFYSDVMQDLVPPSSDYSVKLKSTAPKLVHYTDNGINVKPDVDVKRERVKSKSERLTGDSYLASQLDEVVDSRLSSGSYDSSSLYKMLSEESTAVKSLGLYVKKSGTEELCLCSNNESEFKSLPSDTSNPENLDSQLSLSSKDGKIYDETVECTTVSSTSSSPAVWTEFKFGNYEDLSKVSDGFYEPVGDEIEGDDIEKEAFQVCQQLGKLKLDESCVLVDKYEHFSVSHPVGKERSYKKKIKDVLYLRSWSSTKNPEPLNVWQEELNSSNHGSREITASSTYASQSGNNNLQSNSLESGWEIL